jgi:hypothetical protein
MRGDLTDEEWAIVGALLRGRGADWQLRGSDLQKRVLQTGARIDVI